MTPADIVAEALAVGLQYTTDDGLLYDDSGKLRPPRHLLVEPDGVRVVDTSSDRDEVLAMAADHEDCSVYYRDDVVDAALAHVAERCAAETKRADALAEHARKTEAVMKDVVRLRLAAEGRAERAEARIAKLRAALDAAAQASGANPVIDLCDDALCVDILDADQADADATVPRG